MKFTSKVTLLAVTAFLLIVNFLVLALLFGRSTKGSIEALQSGPIPALQASDELDQALVAFQQQSTVVVDA